MKKYVTFLVLVVFVFILTGCSLTPTTTIPTTMPTTVDTENVIDISTREELMAIEMNKSYRLMADIDLSGSEWTPLGTYEEPYLGIFDGNFHQISNLTITVRNDMFNGLFAHVSGTVKNLEISDFSIDYTAIFVTYAGGLTGYLSGNVENVQVSGDINLVNTKSNSYVGLLAGIATAKITDTMTALDFVPNEIVNASATGTINVEGKNFVYVGGLTGKIYNSIVNGASVDATIQASSTYYRVYAGGLSGHHYGGILVPFSEVVETVDIPLAENVVIATISVQAPGTQASVGGFLGYSQNGILNQNVVLADVTVAGSNLNASMFVGESWDGTYSKVIALGSFTILASPAEESLFNLSTLTGFTNAGTTIATSYYRVITIETFASTQGEEASLAQITDGAWYDTWLLWDQETALPLTEITALFSE